MSEPLVFVVEPPAEVHIPRTFAQVEAEVLSIELPGYEPRSQQTAAATFVEQIFANKECGLVEAGTGVGKSFGALVPASETGERTLIATATNALLSQYQVKDLPFLKKHLGTDWALIKGISNYACRVKVEEADSLKVANINKLRDELNQKGCDGDKEKLNTPVSPAEWRHVSTTSDECTGSKCPLYDTCFVAAAKARAKEATVVVTNQMMLMADTLITEATDGGIKMLGEYNQVIVDEAHELQDWATKALTFEMNKRGIELLASEANEFLTTHGASRVDGHEVIRAVADLWDVFPEDDGRLRLSFFVEHADQFLALVQALDELWDAMMGLRISTEDKYAYNRKMRIIRRLLSYIEKITEVTTARDSEYVRWTRTEERTYSGRKQDVRVFTAAPVDVSGWLRENLWNGRSAVLVSATLKAGGDFKYIQEQLGLQDAKTLDVGTSFDFTQQSLLFTPAENVPSPKNRNGWQAYAAEATMDMVNAAGGGALLLFTSRSAMRDAHQRLSGRLRTKGYTVLIQGEGTNQELARRFTDDHDSVLFALRSFFTGVSFEGDTCFPAGTMVRTSRGYKPIENIQVGDSVWTHKRRYRRVNATSVRPYEGDMVEITPTSGDSVLTTPNHPILVSKYGRGRWNSSVISTPGEHERRIGRRRGREDRKKVSLDFVPAGDLTIDDWLALPIGDAYREGYKPLGRAYKSGHTKTSSSRNGRNSWEESEEFWELVGEWAAEGSLSVEYIKASKEPGRGRAVRTVVWSWGHHEVETHAKRCADLIEGVLGQRVTPRVVGSVTRVEVKNSAFALWLRDNVGCGARNKMVPLRLRRSPYSGFRRAFIEGYRAGDGTTTKDGHDSTTSGSFQLSAQVRDLVLGLGYAATLKRQWIENEMNPDGDWYWTVVWQRSQRVVSNIDEKYTVAPPRSIKRIEGWSGLVYNIEVDVDESYTLPNFGVHNCRLVIIDKLPFPVPTEPIFEARSEKYGSRSFSKLSIPMMSLVLQQALGRLIRTKRDRGVIAVLDSRLTSTGYGRQIVRSLPPAPETHSMDDVRAFFGRAA